MFYNFRWALENSNGDAPILAQRTDPKDNHFQYNE
jgi:hypothetical protein